MIILYCDRVRLYSELENEFSSKLIVYVTSDRLNMGAQISSDVINFLIEHLDKIGSCDKISLYLYTRGGDTSAARNIVNLLRMYCKQLQVIIPHKAHSAGTIISIGANEIVMTKQATLGPIDPSIQTALNPHDDAGDLFPVSVEAVKGYLAFAKDELGITDQAALADIFKKLTESVHPLVLGEVYRSRAQIQMLAEKLLKNHVTDAEKVKKIIDFLCSESGSHDYTINRREAMEELGLNIVKPDDRQYDIIKKIYDDIRDELIFDRPFDFNTINGAFSARRCLLESVVGGSDYYSTEGNVEIAIGSDGKPFKYIRSSYEGWRHDDLYDDGHMVFNDKNEEVVYERAEGSEYQT